jgi:hypothetical protein
MCLALTNYLRKITFITRQKQNLNSETHNNDANTSEMLEK